MEYISVFLLKRDVVNNLDILSLKVKEKTPPMYEFLNGSEEVYTNVATLLVELIFAVKRIEENNQYLLFR